MFGMIRMIYFDIVENDKKSSAKFYRILYIYQKHKYEQQLAPSRGLLASSLLFIYSITAYSSLHMVYTENEQKYFGVRWLQRTANVKVVLIA